MLCIRNALCHIQICASFVSRLKLSVSNNKIFSAVSLVLRHYCDDDSVDLNWTMTFDLIDAVFSDLFVNLCTGENEYGLNEQVLFFIKT